MCICFWVRALGAGEWIMVAGEGSRDAGNAGAVDNVGGAALASLAKYFERNTAFLPGAALAAAGCLVSSCVAALPPV